MISLGMPPTTFRTEDGLALEAEIALPPDAGATRAGLVICHPHPLHGGSMRSVVVGALFSALPSRGVACLRFNFRGVEGSEGAYSAGDLERLDATAAVSYLVEELGPATPVGLVGWSFGADVALSVLHPGHGGWYVVAPPLKFTTSVAATAGDSRPKRVALGQHDQFRDPAEVEAEMASWTNTRVDVIGGADHFFIGRSDPLVEAASSFVDELGR